MAQLPGPNGPHTDETTTALADQAADTMRTLVYAVRAGSGVTDPSTVCAVVGPLSRAVRSMNAVLAELHEFLSELHETGRLAVDDLTDAAPEWVIDDALEGSDTAARIAAALAGDLESLHTRTGHLKSAPDGVQR